MIWQEFIWMIPNITEHFNQDQTPNGCFNILVPHYGFVNKAHFKHEHL